MFQSKHLAKTLREDPKDAVTIAHKLMLRAGYIKQVSAGVYSYLPLALKVIRKISDIIREEHDNRGCEELLMPMLQPKELWVESGRWERYTEVDGIMFSFKDRRNSEVCLGPTSEEVITDIIRQEVSSYKDLPKIPYQIQTKFRDEIRPRFGLMRAREFIMKDAYSFDCDEASLNESYNLMREVYHSICKRMGIEYRCVKADSGAIGGDNSEEFMVLAETGEDEILYCDSCNYAANSEKAESILEDFEQDSKEEPMEEVLGEGLIGVEALAKFLNIPVWKTTKTILFEAVKQDDSLEIIAVMVRGDSEVNELKVINKLNLKNLTLITPEKITELTGAKVGYAGPIGLPENVKVIADNYVANRVNFECGANKSNFHNINVNFGRDLEEPEYFDLKLAKKDDFCPVCKNGQSKLKSARGIEVGHIFQLGTKYSKPLNCNYLDKNGESKTIHMGCYGIGISRMVASVIEQNNDENGIIWPAALSPYHIHLIGLNLEKEDVKVEVHAFYEELKSLGFDVFFDDRETRAGEKFSDADLIGISARVTMSARTIKNNDFELKLRNEIEAKKLSKDDLIKEIKNLYSI